MASRPLAAGHQLGAAQAEYAGVAKGPQRPTLVAAAQAVSCVEDQTQPVLIRQVLERSMSAGSPKTWTAAIPTVRGVISRRASFTSMQ